MIRNGVLGFVGFCALSVGAEVTVSNLVLAQREGTKVVDIIYDVSNTSTNVVTVSLVISNGAFAVACPSVSGDVGAGVVTGTGKSLAWDMAEDWNGNAALLQYTVVAEHQQSVLEKFVLIEAGTAAGGSPSSSNDFYLAKHEVTKNLWDEIAEWAEDHGYDIRPGGGGGSGDCPVVYVVWYECVKWCNAWSEKTGRTPAYTVGGLIYRSGERSDVDCDFSAGGFHLPSDTQWEYAARGGKNGSDTKYSGGDTLGDVAWYQDNSYNRSHEVGTKAVNELGVFDMSGNVWEWCNDWYPGKEGSYRVLRGGGWYNTASYCRLLNRYHSSPGGAGGGSVGFRPAMPPQ